MLQLGNGCTTDCQPVYVSFIRGAAGTNITPGVVEVVEVAITNQDIEALLRPGGMSHLAGSAHIVQVLFLVFHAL